MIKLKKIEKGKIIALVIFSALGGFLITDAAIGLAIPEQYRAELDVSTPLMNVATLLLGVIFIIVSAVMIIETVNDIPADESKLPDFIKQEIEEKARELLIKASQETIT